MAVSNAWNPSFEQVEFNGGPIIYVGTSTLATEILAEHGYATPGAIYISTAGSGTLWVGQSSIWTSLTVN